MTRPDLYSFRELWRQYRTCRRNKRNTLNALAFEVDAEAKLLELQSELREHAYRPGTSICFVTGGPKPREVFAADFRDRIVHHLLVSHLEPVFEPCFVHDSYACRRGKGVLAASDRLMQLLRRITANGHRPAWALKLDVASFFSSIHKQTLFEIIARRVRDPELLWLTRTILFHDPTTDYRFRSAGSRVGGPKTEQYPIAERKSLFGKRNRRGLPIGNLTSQFWANIYMNEVDQFAKRRLRCRHYVRYVDDMILLSRDPRELIAWRGRVRSFLRERLDLDLRPGGSDPFPVRRGIDFIGWKTWWNRRLPRRRTAGRLRQRLDRFAREAVRPAYGGRARQIALVGYRRPVRRGCGCGPARRVTTRVEQLGAALASYSGYLRHGAAWRDWARLWGEYAWLSLLFERDGWAFVERWPVRPVAAALGFRRQYARLLLHAGRGSVVFCQVGRFVEFYGPQRMLAQAVLGLKPAHVPRAGYAMTCGFPFWLQARFATRAIEVGRAVVQVRERKRYGSAGKTRVPVAIVYRRECSVRGAHPTGRTRLVG